MPAGSVRDITMINYERFLTQTQASADSPQSGPPDSQHQKEDYEPRKICTQQRGMAQNGNNGLWSRVKRVVLGQRHNEMLTLKSLSQSAEAWPSSVDITELRTPFSGLETEKKSNILSVLPTFTAHIIISLFS